MAPEDILENCERYPAEGMEFEERVVGGFNLARRMNGRCVFTHSRASKDEPMIDMVLQKQ